MAVRIDTALLAASATGAMQEMKITIEFTNSGFSILVKAS
jgi:hypothetical protein